MAQTNPLTTEEFQNALAKAIDDLITYTQKSQVSKKIETERMEFEILMREIAATILQIYEQSFAEKSPEVRNYLVNYKNCFEVTIQKLIAIQNPDNVSPLERNELEAAICNLMIAAQPNNIVREKTKPEVTAPFTAIGLITGAICGAALGALSGAVIGAAFPTLVAAILPLVALIFTIHFMKMSLHDYFAMSYSNLPHIASIGATVGAIGGAAFGLILGAERLSKPIAEKVYKYYYGIVEPSDLLDKTQKLKQSPNICRFFKGNTGTNETQSNPSPRANPSPQP